jgi:hypothetical protein
MVSFGFGEARSTRELVAFNHAMPDRMDALIAPVRH